MKTIYLKNTILNVRSKYTFLKSTANAGDTTIQVESIIGFSTNQILLIGEFGQEKTEIVHTHDTTYPSGNTITLASELTFDHPQGTKVYIIDWDQVEISWSSSTTGGKTTLATISIQADQLETQYTDTAKTSGYYFLKLKNSITGNYSTYSDPIPYTGYPANTVGATIEYALKRNNLKSFTDKITFDWCIEEINQCLRYIRGKLRKWHALQEFDYILGYTQRGEWRFPLPNNMWKYSNKSVLAVRLEGKENLIYKDEREWNELLKDVIYTTLASDISAGDTSITLTNSRSFANSGTIMIKGMTITYTSNDRSTNTLSGIPDSGDGSITQSVSAGFFVWQGNYDEGIPLYYTIKEGYFYHWPLVNSTYTNKNIELDYWKEAPEIDSPADTLDIMRFDMVRFWLTWAIRMEIKNNGERVYTDGDWLIFERILKDALKIEARHGQKYKLKPILNKLPYQKYG